MEKYSDWELWVSDDETTTGEKEVDADQDTDPTFFKLELSPEEGRPGGELIPVDFMLLLFYFSAIAELTGSRKRPAFYVQCVARAIIHGTLTPGSAQRATLLVYDFQFLSHRGTRIKDASICFDFLPSAGGHPGSGPSVKKVGPDERYSMMETTQLESLRKTAKLGISGGAVVSANAEVGGESSVEKTVTFAAEITGSRPFDAWGNYFQAQWALQENPSQANGIVSRLRTCVLLTRENDNDFDCVPYIRITPNLTTRLVSLGSVRSRDEAIPFDPSYEPFNDLEDGQLIDRWDLGSIDMTKLWDFTFWTSYGKAVKQRV